MAESSEWPTGAIISGIVDYMGNWEECLMVSSQNLKGQYCLAYGTYHFPYNPESVYGTSVDYFPKEEASAWDTLQMVKDYLSTVRSSFANLVVFDKCRVQ